MKRKIAALYNPYLDTLGGGEKHILSILKVLEEAGYQIDVFWDQNLAIEIKKRFNLTFSTLKFLPNIFRASFVEALNKIPILKNFDVFFYVTDGSYFFSSAKKNFVFCMVPNKNLYHLNFANRLKTLNYKFIANSRFTASWLKKWGVKSQVIYPQLDDCFLNSKSEQKTNLILSVARFFPHLHSKKQEILITTFNQLVKKDSRFSQWKLVLAGGLNPVDSNYFNTLKKSVSSNKQIQLLPNLSFAELFNYYQKARVFWHFAGYGIDENLHPEMTEHLGITPLEAMSTGGITFCVNAGGPKEIIKDGINGFLFQTQSEIIKKTISIINNEEQQKTIIKNAKQFVKENFNTTVFKKNIAENITRLI